MGALARGNVLAGAGHGDDGDVVVVAPQELLGAADDVADHDGGAQGEEDVLIVGVKHKALIDLTCADELELLGVAYLGSR